MIQAVLTQERNILGSARPQRMTEKRKPAKEHVSACSKADANFYREKAQEAIPMRTQPMAYMKLDDFRITFVKSGFFSG